SSPVTAEALPYPAAANRSDSRFGQMAPEGGAVHPAKAPESRSKCSLVAERRAAIAARPPASRGNEGMRVRQRPALRHRPRPSLRRRDAAGREGPHLLPAAKAACPRWLAAVSWGPFAGTPQAAF